MFQKTFVSSVKTVAIFSAPAVKFMMTSWIIITNYKGKQINNACSFQIQSASILFLNKILTTILKLVI